MLCSELLCVRCLPGLDLVTLLLSLLTKYKTRCSFVHSILSTLNCSVRPHTESQYQWEGVLGKQLLCLLSCFCFQRTVILTNPPETGIILTHLIWQTEEWRHTLPLKAVGAWIRAWKRDVLAQLIWATLLMRTSLWKYASFVSYKYLCFSCTKSWSCLNMWQSRLL